ncbi:MAG: phage tail protein [Methylococcaceae bacterium]|nr:phage tail protein [Methylococcaceae bacterium]
MSEPFLGEIRPFGFSFPPRGWASCDGQLLQIVTNQALFALLGTQYGGNGISTFALPDLRGRGGLHASPQYLQGQQGGVEGVALTGLEMPLHAHVVNCSNQPGDAADLTNNYWAQDANGNVQYSNVSDSNLTAEVINSSGNHLPHNNMQPYLVVNFCIALTGIFPSRN